MKFYLADYQAHVLYQRHGREAVPVGTRWDVRRPAETLAESNDDVKGDGESTKGQATVKKKFVFKLKKPLAESNDDVKGQAPVKKQVKFKFKRTTNLE